MSGGTIDLKCPKCGEHIVQPLSALQAADHLICPRCGTALDFKEVKRGLKEAIEKAKRTPHIVKTRLKL